jgi:hypothetical protein
MAVGASGVIKPAGSTRAFSSAPYTTIKFRVKVQISLALNGLQTSPDQNLIFEY